MEVTYDMYCPLLQKIEVIKREKRLDRELLYLRDCPLEYSTFPQDMEADVIVEGVPVRVNPIKVRPVCAEISVSYIYIESVMS